MSISGFGFQIQMQLILPHTIRRARQRQRDVAVLILAIASVFLGAFQTQALADDVDTAAALLEILLEADPASAKETLASLSEKVQTGEVDAKQTAALQARLGESLGKIVAKGDHPLAFDAALLATLWQDKEARGVVRRVVASADETKERRSQGVAALLAIGDPFGIELANDILSNARNPAELRAAVLGALGRSDSPHIATLVLSGYANYEPELQPKTIELLTQRPVWSKSLLQAIGAGKIPTNALNANQVARLRASPDAELKQLVAAKWGILRTDRNPQREQVVAEMRSYLRRNLGDAEKGAAVFQKVCGQCHKIYGQGQEVGPEITANGRASFEQLLSNVFDPSLVIGAAYQARQVVTTEGRVLTGLVAEENEQRVVLKIQGGKAEAIPRDEIDEMTTSALSLMPEGLEKQLTPPELSDLFAYLVLDRPPTDREAKYLPGTPIDDSPKWKDAMAKFAPGWAAYDMGEHGAAPLEEHRGRKQVLQTHPLDQATPAMLRRVIDVPTSKKTALKFAVSHHEKGDWKLIVRAGGKALHEAVVGPDSVKSGWTDVSVDLSEFAGQKVAIELLNVPTGWSWEFAYWQGIGIESR
jgi:putative heme-binding domain-containing protein